LYKLPQIPNGFGTKIQRCFYELNFNGNSVENLGTLEFDKIWLERSLLHLIASKNKFPAKEHQTFESPLTMEFGLISQ
jgi:hypothetical protein